MWRRGFHRATSRVGRKLIVELSLLRSTANENQAELLKVLRLLSEGKEVPKDRARRAFETARKIGLGALGEAGGGLLLQLFDYAHRFF